MKFTVNETTKVRKAFNDDKKCVAVFGVAADLLNANVLLEASQGCENKVVVIQAPDWRMFEFDTIEQAKKFLNSFSNGIGF
jgi:hypothetical protein